MKEVCYLKITLRMLNEPISIESLKNSNESDLSLKPKVYINGK